MMVVNSLTKDDLDTLQDRCEEVKNKVDDFFTPWFVEFAGLPRSGKSGCIDIVGHFLRQNNFAVLSPSEGASQVPDFIKDSGDLLAYNVWTATYAIRQILEGQYFKGPRYHIILLDRGLFDATVWFHFLEKRHQWEAEKRRFMTMFVRVEDWRTLIKQVFLLNCSITESKNRELKDKLTEKSGITSDEEFLKTLCSAYESAIECYKDDFKIVQIEGESIRPRELAFKIINEIFDDIDERAAQING